MKMIPQFLFAVLLIFSVSGGEKNVGLWDFTSGKTESSIGLFPLELRGSTKVGENGLLIVDSPESKPQGATTRKVHPELSPAAFRLTVRFRLSEKAFSEGRNTFFLWDSKYLHYHAAQDRAEYNRGFMLYLVRSKDGSFRVQAGIGFGTKSDFFSGPAWKTTPGREHTLSFEYDGISRVCFQLDGGRKIERTSVVKGPAAPAFYPTVIGDRILSGYFPFAGEISSVELASIDIPAAGIAFPVRKSFLHNEKSALLKLALTDHTSGGLKNAKVTVSGKDHIVSAVLNPEFIKGDAPSVLDIPVRTDLLPGDYPCSLVLNADSADGPVEIQESFTLQIGPVRNNGDQVRFFWLIPPYPHYYEQMREMGFSHLMSVYTRSPDFETGRFFEIDAANRREFMDKMLADGLGYLEFSVLSRIKSIRQKYPRIRKDGSKNPKTLDAAEPEVLEFCVSLAKQAAAVIGDHPAYSGVLTSTEVRDRSHPSFTPHQEAAFEKATGLKIPPEADGRLAPHYSKLKDFPAGRIVPDDWPLLVYYRWFWKEGDGWNNYQTAISEAYRPRNGQPFFSFYDPAVRVPPVYGSGGKVDFLNHWTYVHPEPYNISYVISEQQAMARGTPGQGVFSMIQGICYRSKLAPKDRVISNPPSWVKDRPNANYITTPPDLMREGLWSAFSRRLDGIGIYAWKALFDAAPLGVLKTAEDYQYTDPDTVKVISEMFHRIGIPLGPLLRKIPERPPEVAVLESYASTFFAGRGSWGWSGKIFECGIMLNAARLAPHVVYEEEIAHGVPDSVKVLIMPHCDVLTRSAFEKIREFQKRGGLVVADEFLVPGILPDFLLPDFPRIQKGDVDKAALQKAAFRLRALLSGFYQPYADSDNSDLLTWVRSSKNADYLFVINDKRTFGDYVGQYGMVMEKGLPNRGKVTIDRESGAVYDLEKHREIPFSSACGRTEIFVDFTTNDGKLFLLTDRPLGKLEIQSPSEARIGGSAGIEVRSPDSGVLIPVQISVTPPDGTSTDDSGYAVVENGIYRKQITFPANAPAGIWKIAVRNLADGEEIVSSLTIRPAS